MEYLIVIAIAFGIGWMLAYKNTSSRERAIRRQEAAAQEQRKRDESDIEKLRVAFAAEMDQKREEIERFKDAWGKEHQRLLNETKDFYKTLDSSFLQGRKWLADAFSEYIETKDLELECSLVVKPNPAWKSAEVVSALRAERTKIVRELKFLQYQLASYEEYFPELLEYRDSILDEDYRPTLDEVLELRISEDAELADTDPALILGILSNDEFNQLSNREKFQLALDRYWVRDKNNAEIGRLYERFIGYLYEQDGWTVQYHGALMGLEDFGRDLICMKNGSVEVIQCKCWSQNKMIREKHIMQLFGTCTLYRITEQCSQAKPVFVTTTSLSEEANMVATELEIEVRNVSLKRYPMIKCNVNLNTEERIYHLPFDQQYDRTIIGNQPGEFYASTINEAEDAGFRRAFRWRGEEVDTDK